MTMMMMINSNSMWEKHGHHCSGLLRGMLTVTFWLVETVQVIGSLEPCLYPYTYLCVGPRLGRWGGAGIAQGLERRTRDWKVAGSNPCWNGGRIFFSRVDFLCWLLFRYPFQPRVTTVARKKSRSFCQKCRWQVTAKTRIHLTYVAFIEPCFGICHKLVPNYVKWHLRTLSINSSII